MPGLIMPNGLRYNSAILLERMNPFPWHPVAARARLEGLTRGGLVPEATSLDGAPKRWRPALLSPATALLSSPMAQLALHHVNLIVTDLPRSLAFYQNLFGLTIIERPPFKGAGAWLACGALQVHLTLYPSGSFRTGNVDGADCHFCFPHR
jgi:hypothetical protein